MPVTFERQGEIAVLTIDNPPVNAASRAVREALMERLAEANADGDIGAIVLICAGRTFVAGADVKEFGAPPQPPYLTDVTDAIENSAKPVVAAVHGTALGGGFELALAAHARISTADAEFGLPEVKLGIVPGAGGTQRLPRLAGIPKAIDLVSSGRRLSAREAFESGIIDGIAQQDLLSAAVELARDRAGSEPQRTGHIPLPAFDRPEAERQVKLVKQKARGQVSPGHAARLVLCAADMNLDQGLAAERAAFLELVSSDQSRALRHVFAAERLAAKVPGLEGVAPRDIDIVGIVGAGLMGAGIAVAFLNAGYFVRVVERDQFSVESGRGRIDAIYDRAIKAGKIEEATLVARLARLSMFHDRSALADCDLAIEAVFDELDVKQEVFAAVSKIVRPDAILATNTSYLNPDEIASVVIGPDRFIGLHFFSPANVMRLVEVVRTAAVAPDVLATGLAVAKQLGKVGVVSGVCEGFIGNRIFTAYRQQCDYMLEEGALPHEIDAALEGFGFPMGPYAVNDLAGLDISWARRKRNASKRHPEERYVVIADRLCEAGRFGQKTGKGYYAYQAGRGMVDPEVTAIIESASREAGLVRRVIDADEIISRVSGAIVAEGRAILEEGIALRPSDIDLVMIHGYGYPAWRGGPMYRAGVR